VTDNPRIEELRRRVDRDPASIAFAQLAEEYRRAGDSEEAVRVCEAGLAQHPAYLSARVTLGRALFELGHLEEARAEFTRVLETAPDNIIAQAKLAEIHQRLRHKPPIHDPGPASTPVDSSGKRDRLELSDRVVAELEAWLEVIAERRT